MLSGTQGLSDGELLNGAEHEFLNLFGSVDEDKERAIAYGDALNKYPTTPDCDQTRIQLKNIASEIEALTVAKANATSSGGSGRPQGRAIDAYTRRQTELQQIYDALDCEAIQAKQEQQDFLQQSYSQLEQATKLTSNTDKTSTYVVLGLVGLTVLAAGFLLFKK